MSIFRTDDPAADFVAYDAYQTKLLERCPKCCRCKERIQEDYYTFDGDDVCEECMPDYVAKHFRQRLVIE